GLACPPFSRWKGANSLELRLCSLRNRVFMSDGPDGGRPSLAERDGENNMSDVIDRPVVRVAVLWDFENVHAVVIDQKHGDGTYRRARGNQECLINTGSVTRDIARKVGPIAIHRAYANWARFRVYNNDLASNLIDQVYVPSPSGAKNSADLCLACEA